MSGSDRDGDDLRRALLDSSDHRAVRAVFQAYTGGDDADLRDLVETMRASGGVVALVAEDGAADVYARWNGSRFEHLTVWPPWTVSALDYADRSAIEAYLERKTHVRPILHDRTPFSSPATLASLGHLVWP